MSYPRDQGSPSTDGADMCCLSENNLGSQIMDSHRTVGLPVQSGSSPKKRKRNKRLREEATAVALEKERIDAKKKKKNAKRKQKRKGQLENMDTVVY